MRIETYNQVQQLYKPQKANKNEKTSAAGFKDHLEISSMGKDIQLAKQAVNSSPDIREDVVAPIKERIENGTYEVSTEELAERIMNNPYGM